MVRMASLASFPLNATVRDFYERSEIDDGISEEQYQKRYRDRVRKRKERRTQEALEPQEVHRDSAHMPEEILAIFRRNGGAT